MPQCSYSPRTKTEGCLMRTLNGRTELLEQKTTSLLTNTAITLQEMLHLCASQSTCTKANTIHDPLAANQWGRWPPSPRCWLLHPQAEMHEEAEPVTGVSFPAHVWQVGVEVPQKTSRQSCWKSKSGIGGKISHQRKYAPGKCFLPQKKGISDQQLERSFLQQNQETLISPAGRGHNKVHPFDIISLFSGKGN